MSKAFTVARILGRISLRSLNIIVVVLLALAAGAVAIYTTAHGPWGSQDSVAYIVSARNLLAGRGLGIVSPDGTFRALAQFPPVYPVVLSSLGLLGFDLVAASRWLNISLFVLTVLLTAAIFIRHTSAPALAIPACLLLAVFPTTVRMFSSSLSEPLFLCLVLAAVLCLLEYSRSMRVRWLVISGALTSLVPLTRYVGIAFLPVMAAGAYLLLPGARASRLGKAIAFGVATALPILIFAVAAVLTGAGAGTGWQIRFDQAYVAHQASEFFYSVIPFVATWVPYGSGLTEWRLRYSYGAITLSLAAVAAVVFIASRQLEKAARTALIRETTLFWLSWLWILAYFAVLLVTTFFTTAVPAISNRMLLPIYIGLVLGILSAIAVVQAVWLTGRRSWLRALPWAMALWALVYYLPQTISDVAVPLHAGSGPTSYVWRDSQIIAAVRGLPQDVEIVSNHPYTIELWVERPTFGMLENMRLSFVDLDTPYGSDRSDAAQAAFRDGAALVIFEPGLGQQLEDVFGRPGRARLDTLFDGLTVAGRYPEGTIYNFR